MQHAKKNACDYASFKLNETNLRSLQNLPEIEQVTNATKKHVKAEALTMGTREPVSVSGNSA